MRWWHRLRGHKVRWGSPHVAMWDDNWVQVEVLEQGYIICSCGKRWPV